MRLGYCSLRSEEEFTLNAVNSGWELQKASEQEVDKVKPLFIDSPARIM